jgi:NadR type nicotinamide-nucleotide adenylyltransferase
MEPLLKIVAIGPESAGKSTLCAQLAAHYNTEWCPEYARAYLTQRGPAYTYADLLSIAQGQLMEEERFAERVLNSRAGTDNARQSLLFIDTDLYVMKVWSEYVFKDCHPWILDQLADRSYHLYLLCKPDIEWVEDELREYPDQSTRDRLYHYYKELLVNQSTPWIEISGDASLRLQTAVAAVESLRQAAV